jgi:ORF6N domain
MADRGPQPSSTEVIAMPAIEEDFMFQLRKDEAAALRSQIATSITGRGGRRYAPYVFTEQGVAMLSSVLRSKTAIAVNIEIMRAFVELRRVAHSYAVIEKRLEQIERRSRDSAKVWSAGSSSVGSADRLGPVGVDV